MIRLWESDSVLEEARLTSVTLTRVGCCHIVVTASSRLKYLFSYFVVIAVSRRALQPHVQPVIAYTRCNLPNRRVERSEKDLVTQEAQRLMLPHWGSGLAAGL